MNGRPVARVEARKLVTAAETLRSLHRAQQAGEGGDARSAGEKVDAAARVLVEGCTHGTIEVRGIAVALIVEIAQTGLFDPVKTGSVLASLLDVVDPRSIRSDYIRFSIIEDSFRALAILVKRSLVKGDVGIAAASTLVSLVFERERILEMYWELPPSRSKGEEGETFSLQQSFIVDMLISGLETAPVPLLTVILDFVGADPLPSVIEKIRQFFAKLVESTDLARDRIARIFHRSPQTEQWLVDAITGLRADATRERTYAALRTELDSVIYVLSQGRKEGDARNRIQGVGGKRDYVHLDNELPRPQRKRSRWGNVEPPGETIPNETQSEVVSWKGVLKKAGGMVCQLEITKNVSVVGVYSPGDTRTEPSDWPKEIDIQKRADITSIINYILSKPSNRRAGLLVEAKAADSVESQKRTSFIQGLSDKARAGVLKISAGRTLYLLPQATSVNKALGMGPKERAGEVLIGVILFPDVKQ